ncbi:pseudouridine synthase, partial [Mangrovicoccus algicola]
MTDSTPSPEGERIAKVLARAGVASRREAETIIAEGRVRVNGRLITSPALNVTPGDRILVDGEPLKEAEPPRIWLYHKPAGLVTTAKDEKGRETIFDKLPETMPRVMSIGRLDLNSEGLLLLTNDGALKRRLELPATGWLRKYRVRVKGTPEDAALEPLRRGLTIEGERFQPMDVSLDRQQGANAWLTVGLREGRNREIRRAMESVGLVVNRLIRVSYGPFRLNDLAAGAVEEVRERVLRDQLGLGPAEEQPRPKPQRTRRGGPAPRGAKGDAWAERGPAPARGELTTRPPRAAGKPGFKDGGREDRPGRGAGPASGAKSPRGKGPAAQGEPRGERQGRAATGRPGATPPRNGRAASQGSGREDRQGRGPEGKPGAKPQRPGAAPGTKPAGRPGPKPG